MDESVAITRVIDLPPSVVEEAFTDPVLAEGWFHPTLLPSASEAQFAIDEVAGGTRGASTRVTVTAATAAEADHRLDLLENLLRGHPVDWTAEARRDTGVA